MQDGGGGCVVRGGGWREYKWMKEKLFLIETFQSTLNFFSILFPLVQYGPRERVHAGAGLRVRGREFEGLRARD